MILSASELSREAQVEVGNRKGGRDRWRRLGRFDLTFDSTTFAARPQHVLLFVFVLPLFLPRCTSRRAANLVQFSSSERDTCLMTL